MMKFIPNPRAAALLAAGGDMVAYLKYRAEAAVKVARETAPVLTGDYRDGLEADSGVEDGHAVALINAKDFKSNWIEFGTVNEPAHATLRRAAEATGLSLRGGRKA